LKKKKAKRIQSKEKKLEDGIFLKKNSTQRLNLETSQPDSLSSLGLKLISV
jgi:hypothetical protein